LSVRMSPSPSGLRSVRARRGGAIARDRLEIFGVNNIVDIRLQREIGVDLINAEEIEPPIARNAAMSRGRIARADIIGAGAEGQAGVIA